MNRKQKIIVSITGIFIVMLALVGLTYAYFLTRITGNENDKSVSVTTAKLELVYGDNSAEIIKGTGALMPTVETDADDAIGTKTFTVTNNGNDSSYVVIIDNVETKYASNGSYKDENGNTITYTKDQETEFVTNDFRYTLTCVVKDKSGNAISNETCNDVETLSVFPIKGGILVGNGIVENRVHEYTLTLWYIDNGQNQSIDMNKTYQARVNISDINQMENPFKTGVTETDNASLAYNIINNAKENKNGTQFVNTPLTTPAVSVNEALGSGIFINETVTTSSLCSEYYSWLVGDSVSAAQSGTTVSSYEDAVGKYVYDDCSLWTKYLESYDSTTSTLIFKSEKISTENILTTTQDDYGISYYFRGDVEDNYVIFSNKCWRIVRIQGDGSIKLALESQSSCSESMTSNFSIGEADWGYYIGKNGKYIGDYKNSTTGMKNLLTTWLNETEEVGGEQVRKNITLEAEALLKTEEWCLGNTTNTYAYDSPYALLGTTAFENYTAEKGFYYETGRNLYGKGVTPNATLKCNGETDSSKIGALTADEVVFAGGKTGEPNTNFYLKNVDYYWWTLSRSNFRFGDVDCVFYVSRDENVLTDNVDDGYDVRPAVSLNAGIKITGGEGTRKNPYIIDEN